MLLAPGRLTLAELHAFALSDERLEIDADTRERLVAPAERVEIRERKPAGLEPHAQ